MPEKDGSEKLTRGSAINGFVKYIKNKWGAEGERQCRSDIGLKIVLKDNSYYPDRILQNILTWIAKEKGMDYVREGGKYTTMHLGMISWLMRFADMKTIAKRLPSNYREVYNFGKAEVDISEEHKIYLRLWDVVTYEAAYASWIGVCEGTLEASKTKGKVTIIKNSLEGDEYAEFLIEY
ncbi:MAG: DUF2378 family protein [Thermoplasmata archaeon]|nr:DUF2378 family protein [Thermoplasmata archaeon]